MKQASFSRFSRRHQNQRRETVKKIRKPIRTTTMAALLSAVTGTAMIGMTAYSFAQPGNSSNSASWSQFANSCNPDPFACGPEWIASHGGSLPSMPSSSQTSSISSIASYFPSSWAVMHHNVDNQAVIEKPGVQNTPLNNATAWASPLTGLEIVRAGAGFDRYGVGNGGSLWGAAAAETLGNVTGVTAVDGIIYLEDNNTLYALNALTGLPVWQTKVANTIMGNPIVENVNGRQLVFIAEGDLGWTLGNTLDRVGKGSPQQNPAWGYGFSGVYAIDANTGQIVWQDTTRGEVMPTPAYYNGSLIFDTGAGHMWVVNALTGAVEAKVAVPGTGVNCMSSVNLYRTPQGQELAIFGTDTPYLGSLASPVGDALDAFNITNPASPTLAWSYAIPGAVGTSAGGDPAAVSQSKGIVVTDVLISSPGQSASVNPLSTELVAINASTGMPMWTQDLGTSPTTPASLKNSVPMINGNTVYVGDVLNQTFQAFNLTTGTRLWSTTLSSSRDLAGTIHMPRAAAVYYQGKLILAEGYNIWTLDAATGKVLNDFVDGDIFGIFGITSPVIVGNTMYLAALSGWAFAVPVGFITTNPGPGPFHFPGVLEEQGPPVAQLAKLLPGRPADYNNPGAMPTRQLAAAFPRLWTSFEGNPQHEAYYKGDKRDSFQWSQPLPGAVPLSAPAPGSQVLGTQVASSITSLTYGTGTAVAPANGIIYTDSENGAIEALNAETGQVLWQFDDYTMDGSQPLVTPNAVVVSSGDQALKNATGTALDTGKPGVYIGMGFENLHGLNPLTGNEEWSLYTKGTDVMTPLYYKGNLYWVSGSGTVWAINATSGDTIAPFENQQGAPTLSLGAINAVDAANIVNGPNNTPLMIVGTANPAKIFAINLKTDTVAWSASLPSSLTPYVTGFAASTPAVTKNGKTIVFSIITNPQQTNGMVTGTETLLALRARNGQIAWQSNLGSGPVPYGWVAPTPLIQDDSIYLANPLNNTEYRVSANDGSVEWNVSLPQAQAAPGVVVDNKTLIQPDGSDILAIDTNSGAILKTTEVGGSFMTDSPTVVGGTLYIGNEWGWIMAMNLASLE
jgi:outer membrane protein assembly factor BamB